MEDFIEILEKQFSNQIKLLKAEWSAAKLTWYEFQQTLLLVKQNGSDQVGVSSYSMPLTWPIVTQISIAI